MNTKVIGLGDKHFAAWIVHTDEKGMARLVDIPRAVSSGHETYRVDDKLGAMISALQKADASQEANWPGRNADAIARVDRNLGGQAHHSDPKRDTRTIDGTNHVLCQLHTSLQQRGLTTRHDQAGKPTAPAGAGSRKAVQQACKLGM